MIDDACLSCGVPLTDENRSGSDGRKKCKACHAAYERKRRSKNRAQINARQREIWAANPLRWKHYRLRGKYGITLEQYDALLAAQSGRCAICMVPFSDTQPYVDHDHATGEIRGLLCNSCNNGLGRFKDDPSRLRNAAAYLDLGPVKWLEVLGYDRPPVRASDVRGPTLQELGCGGTDADDDPRRRE